jgi:hypothetical protein
VAYSETGTITLKLVVQDLMSGNVGKAVAGLDKMAQKGGLVGAVAQGVGQSFGQMLNPIGLATSAFGFATDYMGSAITAASDLAETQSKLDQVFKTQAGVVREWAADSARSMGLSKQAALEAAGTFGNFLEAMGEAEPAAASMSTTMVQLAGDLGSFNNVDPTEVLDALRSGLSGETEPLRKFGVDISDAAVQTELLREGLNKTSSGFTQAQKIQGRYALIMRQTTSAQGDFARTSDGLANSQRTLDAEMSDLSATIGTELKPILADLVHFVAQYVVPALEAIHTAIVTASNGAAQWSQDQKTAFDEFNKTLLDNMAVAGNWLKMQDLMGQAVGLTADQMNNELNARMQDMTLTQEAAIAQIYAEWKDGRFVSAIPKAAGDLGQQTADAITTPIATVPKKVAAVAYQIPPNIVDGLKSGVSEVRSASKALRDAILNPMKPVNDLAYIRGQLTGKDLRRGLHSQDPYVRKQAQITRSTYLNALDGIVAGGYVRGYDAGAALIDGLRASGVLDQVAGMFGLGGAREYVTPKGNRPKGFSKWSAKRRRNWMQQHPGRASGGPVAAGESYIVGEGGEPEVLTMGSQSGRITPMSKLGGSIHLHIYAAFGSPSEIQNGVRRLMPELRRQFASAGLIGG